MIKRSKNKKVNAIDLILDFKSTWSKFDQKIPKKNSKEMITYSKNGPKKFEKIDAEDTPTNFFPKKTQNIQKKLKKKSSITCAISLLTMVQALFPLEDRVTILIYLLIK